MEVLVLALYVDESSDDDMFIVGGLLADVEAWEEFCEDWNELLALDPPMPHWHQSYAYAHVAPFDHLTPNEVKTREARLARAILKLCPRTLGIRMTGELYRREVRGKVNPPPATDAIMAARRNLAIAVSDPPYYFMHFGWIEQLRRMLDEIGTQESVRIIIERSPRKAVDDAVEYAVMAMQRMHEREGVVLPIQSVTHEYGKTPNARPLEAADMFAWVLRRHHSGRARGRMLKTHHVVNTIRQLADHEVPRRAAPAVRAQPLEVDRRGQGDVVGRRPPRTVDWLLLPPMGVAHRIARRAGRPQPQQAVRAGVQNGVLFKAFHAD